MLRLLAVGNIALIMTALLATVFQATRQSKIPAYVLMGLTPLEALALWWAVPVYGAKAAATLFGLTCAMAFVLQLMLYLRSIPPLQWRSAGWWGLRYTMGLTLAVVTYHVLYSTSHLFVTSAMLAGVAYLLGMVVLGMMPLHYSLQKRRLKLTPG